MAISVAIICNLHFSLALDVKFQALWNRCRQLLHSASLYDIFFYLGQLYVVTLSLTVTAIPQLPVSRTDALCVAADLSASAHRVRSKFTCLRV